MDLSIEPMLAKSVPTVPESAPKGGSLSYEPKWDGFRGIVTVQGGSVEIASRGSKPLTRYFPELVTAFADQLPDGTVLDGEVIVRRPHAGGERLDWEALSQRIHPAASRITRLSEETPASFVAFDLLAAGGRSCIDEPFEVRRKRLEDLSPSLHAPLHVTRTTRDMAEAERWLVSFEGAGLDGVVAKPLSDPYQPGKRAMLKIKHARTADCVVTGYRIHKSGVGVGSVLLGLYDSAGELRGVGGISAFTDAKRRALIDEFDEYVVRDDDGESVRGEGDRSRFSSSKDTSFVMLEPKLVVEVRYDQMEGDRFRHTVQFERWRPDREPRSCDFEQLEVPAAYDLGDVLSGVR